MQMTGEQRIDAPIAVVWRGLNDPETLKACIPGCQSLEVIAENRFRASATIKVGPISARFGGEVELSDLDPPHSYRITGEGSGGVAGAAKGGARVTLEPQGQSTLLRYEVDAEVQGRLAQLGGKLIDATAKQLAGVFFSRFSETVSDPSFGEVGESAPAAAQPRQEASYPSTHAPPPPQFAAAATPAAKSYTGILALLALLAGFILGRAALDWDGASMLSGVAIGLLAVLAGWVGFAIGRGQTSNPQVILLDSRTLSGSASANGPQRP